MQHVDEHIDAVAFIDALFEFLTDGEIIVISMLLEDPKTSMVAIGKHLGLTRERARRIKASAFKKARLLQGEIETGEPSVPLRAALRRWDIPTTPATGWSETTSGGHGSNGGENLGATTPERNNAMAQTVEHQVGIAKPDIIEQYAGDVEVRVLSKCFIEVEGRSREFQPGSYSVTQEVADQMLAHSDLVELVAS